MQMYAHVIVHTDAQERLSLLGVSIFCKFSYLCVVAALAELMTQARGGILGTGACILGRAR